MKNIFFITPPDARYGFALTGVIQILTDVEGLQPSIEQLVEEEKSGLLVVDERLLGKDGDKTIQAFEKKWPGPIIILPSPQKTGAEEKDYAQQLITRAIGYHVRLNI